MSDAPAGDNFYERHDRHWVPAAERFEYPVRQGDLFAAVEVAGERWSAALLIHPTCELPKPAVRRVQVARVRPLAELGDAGQRARVVAGLSVDLNGVRVGSSSLTPTSSPRLRMVVWPSRCSRTCARSRWSTARSSPRTGARPR